VSSTRASTWARRDELKTLIVAKNQNVLGSAGKGKEIFN